MICGKKEYPSKEEAQRVSTLITRRNVTVKELVPYRCPYCRPGVWHLKTKTKETSAQRNARSKRKRLRRMEET